MALLFEKLKDRLLEQLVRLNSHFEENFFQALCLEIRIILAKVFFKEIEAWLLEQAKNNLPVAYGVLAKLYLEIKDFENAKEFSLKANEHFPHLAVWQDIINEATWDQFEEENSSASTD
ncbi:MAG TPA: hypothetical protein ENN28_02590 [Candidatus Uhrbacteria bacterium]|nr:hypothetical protein [Candidatus Uhrbacteria bacterium]